MDNPIYLQRRLKLDRPTLDHDLIETTEVAVTVLERHPELSLITGVELMRYCYLQGCPERGRRLPTANPYNQGKNKRGHVNSYIVGPGWLNEWNHIDQMCEPARSKGYAPEQEYARNMGHAMVYDTWKDPDGGLWFCNEATEREASFSLDSWVRQHRTIAQPPPVGWTLFTRPNQPSPTETSTLKA